MLLENEKKLLWDVVRKINNAWTRGEVGTIAPYFHDDVVVAGTNFKQITKSKEKLIQSYQHFCDNAEIKHFSESEQTIDIIADTGIVSYTWNIKYVMNNIEHEETGKEILVFTKIDEKWSIVWRSLIAEEK